MESRRSRRDQQSICELPLFTRSFLITNAHLNSPQISLGFTILNLIVLECKLKDMLLCNSRSAQGEGFIKPPALENEV